MLLQQRRLSIPQAPSLALLEDQRLYPEGDVNTTISVRDPRDTQPKLFENDMDDIASVFLPKELKS